MSSQRESIPVYKYSRAGRPPRCCVFSRVDVGSVSVSIVSSDGFWCSVIFMIRNPRVYYDEILSCYTVLSSMYALSLYTDANTSMQIKSHTVWLCALWQVTLKR